MMKEAQKRYGHLSTDFYTILNMMTRFNWLNGTITDDMVHIINQSFEQSLYPACFKNSFVPIPKIDQPKTLIIIDHCLYNHYCLK